MTGVVSTAEIRQVPIIDYDTDDSIFNWDSMCGLRGQSKDQLDKLRSWVLCRKILENHLRPSPRLGIFQRFWFKESRRNVDVDVVPFNFQLSTFNNFKFQTSSLDDSRAQPNLSTFNHWHPMVHSSQFTRSQTQTIWSHDVTVNCYIRSFSVASWLHDVTNDEAATRQH